MILTSTSRFSFSIFLPLFLLAFFTTLTSALYAEHAGIVDWHKPLIGEWVLEPTPPLFLNRTTTSTLVAGGERVVGVTKRNLLVVLDGESGDLVWRQALEEDDPVVSFHVHDDSILLLSGSGASTARYFSLATGHLQWERILVPAQGRLTTPAWLGTDVAFVNPQEAEGDGSVVVLSEGRRVSRLRLGDGGLLWSMESPGAGSTILFKQLIVSGSSVHVLALHSSFASQTLLTSTLDLATSIPKADFGQVPSIVHVPEQAVIATSSKDGAATVVWTEHGRIRTVTVKEDGTIGGTKDLLPGKGRKYDSLIDIGLRGKGIVLGKRQDGGAEVIDVSQARKVEEFELSADSPERSPSTYSAAQTKTGVVINRVYWSFNMNVGVAQTIHISDLTSTDVITSGFTFNFDTTSHGVLLHAAVSPSLDAKQLPTLILSTSSGAIQRMALDAPGWIREESLADVKAVRFVDLGEPEVEEVRGVMAEESFVGRTIRQLAEFVDLPAYLVRFVKRFTAASYTSAIQTAPLNTTHLHRDQFGFQKLLVVATGKGKVFALDSANGGIVWSKNLGLTTEKGSEVDINKMWLVRDGEGGRAPLLAILAVKRVGETVSTVAYHLNAYTGAVNGEVDGITGLPIGKVLFPGEPQTAFLTQFENCGSGAKVLAVIDAETKLHIFPFCKKILTKVSEISDKMFFYTESRSIDGSSIRGYVPGASSSDSSFTSSLIWSHPFREREIVLQNEPVIFEAIASFGRVLGDKSTLYKYLNPHLLVISTFTPPEKGVASQAAIGTGRVYVIDSTTGEEIYSTEIDGVVERGGVQAQMVENWLVYSWLSEKGWRLGSVELYEDTEGKGVTPAVSSFDGQKVKAIEQTFIFPTEVQALGFTTSKAGIATKELVFVNGRNQVASVPRRLLDPRRPMGKPSSMDKEEMLIPYDVLLPVDQRKVISHKYDVQGAKHLISSPALVESTSLLLAYGLDLFFTRGLTPSGTFDILTDNFNKVQLLLTLGALSAGIFVAGPAVKSKKLRMKWY
ncbi:hypothetical protein CI109_106399 [Kwoniella shandongensis]|uniref:ER membrane protein complex subunit 1 n=1 Tax=Kwoniella shandongensis TaxID=1734106 RepID=A0A5M6BXJ9_9TREE|nr:uncharacterized protein CI109_005892 [Kwoniella shandongensis]KAA5525729.1 hypothetical protein CI109_005892 [Kwoniella shandongensis]